MSRPELILVWNRPLAKRKKHTNNTQPAERLDPPTMPAPPSQTWGTQLFNYLKSPAFIVMAALTLVNFAFFVGAWYVRHDLELSLTKEIDKTTSQKVTAATSNLGDLKKSVDGFTADLQKQTERLDRAISDISELRGILIGLTGYRQKAMSLGFVKPQFTPFSLVKTTHEKLNFPSSVAYDLEFTIEVKGNRVKLSFTGTLGGMTFRDNSLTIPFEIGKPIELIGPAGRLISRKDLPRIAVVILDVPTKETAILAIGQQDSTAKS